MGVKDEFAKLAGYNRWANERLYASAATLSDDEYRCDLRAFFGSVHATLNHLLLVDRLWLERLRGRGESRPALESIVFHDFEELWRAREAEDDGIVSFIQGLDEAALAASVGYATGSASKQHNTRHEILTHLFNHQTHHRGQAHALLTRLGRPGPELDFIYFLREFPRERTA